MGAALRAVLMYADDASSGGAVARQVRNTRQHPPGHLISIEVNHGVDHLDFGGGSGAISLACERGRPKVRNDAIKRPRLLHLTLSNSSAVNLAPHNACCRLAGRGFGAHLWSC